MLFDELGATPAALGQPEEVLVPSRKLLLIVTGEFVLPPTSALNPKLAEVVGVQPKNNVKL